MFNSAAYVTTKQDIWEHSISDFSLHLHLHSIINGCRHNSPTKMIVLVNNLNKLLVSVYSVRRDVLTRRKENKM